MPGLVKPKCDQCPIHAACTEVFAETCPPCSTKKRKDTVSVLDMVKQADHEMAAAAGKWIQLKRLIREGAA